MLPLKDQEEHNTATIKRNIALSQRRSAGEKDVPLDDYLFVIKPKVVEPAAPRARIVARPELPASVGAAPPSGFSAHILSLAEHGIYLPMSLFVPRVLVYLNAHAHSVELKEFFNRLAKPGEKTKVSLLNIDKLEKALNISELTFIYADWSRAWGNYLRFLAEHGDVNGDLLKRWDLHYSGLLDEIDHDTNFEATLRVDSRIRTSYVHRPVAFCAQVLHNMYVEEKARVVEENVTRTSTRMDQHLDSGKSTPSLSRNQSGSGGGQKSYQGGPSRSNGSGSGRPSPYPDSRSFQGDRPRNCIVCAGEGHSIADCPSSSYPDGKPVYASFNAEKCFVVASTGKQLCIRWNTGGDRGVCKHEAGDKTREHLCSFCGATDHHAFSWSCRARPAKA